MTIRKRNPFEMLSPINLSDTLAVNQLRELLGPDADLIRATTDALAVLRDLTDEARAAQFVGFRRFTVSAPHFNERGIGARVRFSDDGRTRAVRYLTDLIHCDEYFAVTLSDAAEFGAIDPADLHTIAA